MFVLTSCQQPDGNTRLYFGLTNDLGGAGWEGTDHGPPVTELELRQPTQKPHRNTDTTGRILVLDPHKSINKPTSRKFLLKGGAPPGALLSPHEGTTSLPLCRPTIGDRSSATEYNHRDGITDVRL